MDSFYTMPDSMRIIFTMTTIIAAVAAALVFTLRRYRYEHAAYYWFDTALYFLILIQMMICILLLAQVQFSIIEGAPQQGAYPLLRHAIFTAIAIVFAFHIVIKKPLLPLIGLIASFLTLPIVETWTGGLFPLSFAAAILIILVSSIWVIIKTRRELGSSLSGLSVMRAMDSLNTAVLYYRKNGHILLRNEKMRELMIKTAGRVSYNGKRFLETVVVANSERLSGPDALTDNYMYRLPDGVWLFSVKEFLFGRSYVTQIFATDVTEQDNINLILQENQLRLIRRQEKLRELVDSIEDIRRSEELLRLRAALHDEQNQKLTFLLRYLRTQGEKAVEQGDRYSALSDFVKQGDKLGDRYSAFSDEQSRGDPLCSELDTLISVYGEAGVRIILNDDMPEDADTASALMHMLREAAANSVIHGYANEIYASISEAGNEIVMRVTDNGTRGPKRMREGTGIADMRRRIAAVGGELKVDTTDGFVLTASVIKT